MKVPFVDLAASHAEVGEALGATITQLIQTSGFIGGAAVDAFEERWASYCGTRHGVGVGNGTDALTLGLRALGIGRGDEVIVPANTFVATAASVALAGAKPVFVDVDESTLLLNTSALEAAFSPRTAAVIAVHLYGQMCDMDTLGDLCRLRGVALIEDACQAHGARWRDRRAGTFGAFAAFSFYPGKNLGALGDAGALVTDDASLAARVRALGNHGRGHHPVGLVSTNSRLDALQAAALDLKLDHLDLWNERRRSAADAYSRLLSDVPGVRLTDQRSESHSVHHLFVIRTAERDALRAELTKYGIVTGIHYEVPCHRHPTFTDAGRAALPVAEAAAVSMISLPMHPHLTADQVCYVVDVIRQFSTDAAMEST